MRIHDLSVGISATLPIWPGNPGIEIARVQDMDKGDHANVSKLSLGVHTGTHVDAPVHFVNGAAGVDTLALEVLVGPALLIELPNVTAVTAPDLESAGIPAGTQRLLIKTHNSQWWGSSDFHQEYVGISEGAARHLVASGIKVLGVDYLSVEQFKTPGAPAHHALLGAGVIVIEGLDLREVEPGIYELICLPLRVVGGDGAPARVILRRS